jgi:hypothetical protein
MNTLYQVPRLDRFDELVTIHRANESRNPFMPESVLLGASLLAVIAMVGMFMLF